MVSVGVLLSLTIKYPMLCIICKLFKSQIWWLDSLCLLCLTILFMESTVFATLFGSVVLVVIT